MVQPLASGGVVGRSERPSHAIAPHPRELRRQRRVGQVHRTRQHNPRSRIAAHRPPTSWDTRPPLGHSETPPPNARTPRTSLPPNTPHHTGQCRGGDEGARAERCGGEACGHGGAAESARGGARGMGRAVQGRGAVVLTRGASGHCIMWYLTQACACPVARRWGPGVARSQYCNREGGQP